MGDIPDTKITRLNVSPSAAAALLLLHLVPGVVVTTNSVQVHCIVDRQRGGGGCD